VHQANANFKSTAGRTTFYPSQMTPHNTAERLVQVNTSRNRRPYLVN
jgi:hypothetical protein